MRIGWGLPCGSRQWCGLAWFSSHTRLAHNITSCGRAARTVRALVHTAAAGRVRRGARPQRARLACPRRERPSGSGAAREARRRPSRSETPAHCMKQARALMRSRRETRAVPLALLAACAVRVANAQGVADSISGAIAAVVYDDCTVAGVSAPPGVALDVACADAASLAHQASCALTCSAGYTGLTGIQPSCDDGAFSAGSVTCTAIVCTRPAGATGYDGGAETISLPSFSASGSCAAGYSGAFVAQPCTANGDYALTGCTTCAAGKYKAASADGTCIDCAAGKYSSATGNAQESDCIGCAAGKFSVTSPSDSDSNCISCIAGKYSTTPASDRDFDCIQCIAGKYSSTTGNAQETDCIGCAAGKFSTTVGSAIVADCIDCIAGKYVDVPASDDASYCIDCEKGKYSETPGVGEASGCILCEDGKFSAKPGRDSAGDCIACPCKDVPDRGEICSTSNAAHTRCDLMNEVLLGTLGWRSIDDNDVAGESAGLCGFSGPMSVFCNDNNTADRSCMCSRLDCDPGYQPNPDGTGCQDCSALPDGGLVNKTKATSPLGSACQECTAGKEPNSDRSNCVNCPDAHRSDGSGCVRCKPGKQQKVDQSECDPCEFIGLNRHSPAGGRCEECEKGKQPNAIRTACIACAEISSLEGYNASDPSAIDPNKTYSTDGTACRECAVGQAPNSDRSDCAVCPSGWVSDGSECLRCGPGKQPKDPRSGCDECRNQGGNKYSPRGEDCEQCRPGEQPSANRTVCLHCSERGTAYFSPLGAECQQCPAGDFPLGKEPNVNRTDCLACSDGEYSDGSHCMCAKGYYNASLGTFRCFESAAMEFRRRAEVQHGCVPCEGDCVVCGLGCSVETPDECGRVSIKKGFAPYVNNPRRRAWLQGGVDNEVLLATFFEQRKNLTACESCSDAKPHIGIYACPRKTLNVTDGEEGPSTCCGEGPVRDTDLEECGILEGMCAKSYSGVLCNDCAPGYTRKGGTCEKCEDTDLPIQDLRDQWWRYPSIVATVFVSNLFAVILFLSIDSIQQNQASKNPEESEDQSSKEKEAQPREEAARRPSLVFALYASSGSVIFVLALVMTIGEEDDSVRTAKWIFTGQMLGPILVTTGMDLFSSKYIMDKIKVSLGFVQGLLAAKDTFRLDFPLTFSWLVELIRDTLSFDVFNFKAPFELGCLTGYRFYEKWWVTFLSPICIALLLAFYDKVLREQKCFSKISRPCPRGKDTSNDNDDSEEELDLHALSPNQLRQKVREAGLEVPTKEEPTSKNDMDKLIKLIIDKHPQPNQSVNDYARVRLCHREIMRATAEAEASRNQSIRVFFLNLLLIFPMVVRTMIDANLCRKLNEFETDGWQPDDTDGLVGDRWMLVDLEVSCDDDTYTSFLVFARFGAFIYPFGVPFGLMFWLWWERRQIRKEWKEHGKAMDPPNAGDDILTKVTKRSKWQAKAWEKFSDKYEFLVKDYKQDYYYWDCVEMMRKVVLAGMLSILGPVQKFFAGGAVSVAAPGSQFQLLVGIFTSTLFMVWVGMRQPFNEKGVSGFKVWADFSGTMVLVLSVMLKGSGSEESLSSAALGMLMLEFAAYPFFHEAMVRTRDWFNNTENVSVLWLRKQTCKRVDDNDDDDDKLLRKLEMPANGTMAMAGAQPRQSDWLSGMGAKVHSEKTKEDLKRSGPTRLEAALQRLQLAKLSFKSPRLNSGVAGTVLDAIGQKKSLCLMVTRGQPSFIDGSTGIGTWRPDGKSLGTDGRLTITVKQWVRKLSLNKAYRPQLRNAI